MSFFIRILGGAWKIRRMVTWIDIIMSNLTCTCFTAEENQEKNVLSKST